MTRPRRVAVIGSGVAGLTAAHVAAQSAHVTLYEADARLGGHADTHERAASLAIDTGFIVHNERTYPTLLRLFAELGVADPGVGDVDVGARRRRPAWSTPARSACAGSSRPRRNLRRPGVPADAGRGPALPPAGPGPARPAAGPGRRATTRRCGTSSPTAASRRTSAGTSWSRWSPRSGRATRRSRSTTRRATCSQFLAAPRDARRSPARRSGAPSPAAPGSTSRGSRAGARRGPRSAPRSPRSSRPPTRVEVTDGNGAVSTYDAVVIATHPDQALAMLAEPTAGAARRCSPRCRTPPTLALLHTDTSLLPRAANARASWNFLRPARRPRGGVTVTYDLTRLQRLRHRHPLPGDARRRATSSTPAP